MSDKIEWKSVIYGAPMQEAVVSNWSYHSKRRLPQVEADESQSLSDDKSGVHNSPQLAYVIYGKVVEKKVSHQDHKRELIDLKVVRCLAIFNKTCRSKNLFPVRMCLRVLSQTNSRSAHFEMRRELVF